MAEVDARLAADSLRVEGLWTLMGFGICYRLELEVLVEIKSLSRHNGTWVEGVRDATSGWQTIQP